MKEWFTAAELAGLDLPDVPGTKSAVIRLAKRQCWQNVRNLAGAPLARRRKGRGGGFEYHYTILPSRAVERLVARDLAKRVAETSSATDKSVVDNRNGHPARTSEEWAWFEGLPESRKRKARERLAALDAVAALKRGGLQVNIAVNEVARQRGVGASTIYAWQDLVGGRDRTDWLPALAPRHAGKTTTVECDPRAWEFVKADYLRLSRPSFETCYRRLEQAAEEHGWQVPSLRTLRRRVEREIPKPVTVLLRQGEDALKRMYPPQERDRTMFHALEAVNADGHKWDVFVRWPDGEIGRPVMVAVQDLYSNKILAWRVDRSENADAVRLAFGDVFRTYGIPDRAWLDNGRGFASKWITGGTPNRYRFKVRPEEPSGILTELGVEIHWTKPYSGQSKPIERAFRDLCDAVAKHPAFEGAYPTKIDDAIAVLARGPGAAFNVQAEDPASMTVDVLAGAIFDGTTATEVAAQTVGPIAAPAANPRIDRIVIDRATGAASRVEGDEAAEPVAPAVPAGKAPAAGIALTVDQTEIVDADITDERALGLLGLGGTADHQVPTGEGLVDGQTEGVDVALDDWLLTRDVSAASGAGANRKVAPGELLRVIRLLTEEADIDREADLLLFYDASAAAVRAIKPEDLGAGSWNLLAEATADNDASVDFTSGITSDYGLFVVDIINAAVQTDDVEMCLRVSDDGGSNWLSTGIYNWGNRTYGSATIEAGAQVESDTLLRLSDNTGSNGIGNDTGEFYSARILLFDLAATEQKLVHYDAVWRRPDGRERFTLGGGGRVLTSSSVDAIRFLATSGNIVGGTFKLYGVK